MGKTCLASCRKVVAQIKSAKAAIWREFRGTLEAHEHVLRLALNEAEALAWVSGVPQLVFPALAREKAESIAAWHDRQRTIHEPQPVAA